MLARSGRVRITIKIIKQSAAYRSIEYEYRSIEYEYDVVNVVRNPLTVSQRLQLPLALAGTLVRLDTSTSSVILNNRARIRGPPLIQTPAPYSIYSETCGGRQRATMKRMI